MTAPRKRKTSVFVSYSHDSEDHKAWVARLAQALRDEDDLTVRFDGFELYGGRDAPHFMEKGLACRRIVVVCTPNYVKKAHGRRGGVGYETSIITSELARSQSSDKFIPLTRVGHRAPKFLGAKIRVPANEPRPFEDVLEELLRAIRKQPPVPMVEKKPPQDPVTIADPTTGPDTSSVNRALATPPLPPDASLSSKARKGPPPPEPPKPQPALPRFVIESDGGHVNIRVVNEGDEVAQRVTVEVNVDDIPSFVLDFGDVFPGEECAISLNDNELPWEFNTRLVTNIAAILQGFPDESLSHEWYGHFVMRYTTASRPAIIHPTAYYIRATTAGERRRGLGTTVIHMAAMPVEQ